MKPVIHKMFLQAGQKGGHLYPFPFRLGKQKGNPAARKIYEGLKKINFPDGRSNPTTDQYANVFRFTLLTYLALTLNSDTQDWRDSGETITIKPSGGLSDFQEFGKQDFLNIASDVFDVLLNDVGNNRVFHLTSDFVDEAMTFLEELAGVPDQNHIAPEARFPIRMGRLYHATVGKKQEITRVVKETASCPFPVTTYIAYPKAPELVESHVFDELNKQERALALDELSNLSAIPVVGVRTETANYFITFSSPNPNHTTIEIYAPQNSLQTDAFYFRHQLTGNGEPVAGLPGFVRQSMHQGNPHSWAAYNGARLDYGSEEDRALVAEDIYFGNFKVCTFAAALCHGAIKNESADLLPVDEFNRVTKIRDAKDEHKIYRVRHVKMPKGSRKRSLVYVPRKHHEVSGHWREYQSGKRVFIKDYSRGNEALGKITKEYVYDTEKEDS